MKLHDRWLCWWHTQIGSFRYRRGDLVAARRHFMQAIEARQEACRPHLYLYRIYLYQRRFRLAIDELTRARQLDPKACGEDVEAYRRGLSFSRDFLACGPVREESPRRHTRTSGEPPPAGTISPLSGSSTSSEFEPRVDGIEPSSVTAEDRREDPRSGRLGEGSVADRSRGTGSPRGPAGDERPRRRLGWFQRRTHRDTPGPRGARRSDAGTGPDRGSSGRRDNVRRVLGDCRDLFEVARFQRMGPIRPEELLDIDWIDLERRLQREDPPAI